MSGYQPVSVIGSYFYLSQYVVYTQYRVVKNMHGVVNGGFAHSYPGFIEEHSVSCQENYSGEQYGPQAEFGG